MKLTNDFHKDINLVLSMCPTQLVKLILPLFVYRQPFSAAPCIGVVPRAFQFHSRRQWIKHTSGFFAITEGLFELHCGMLTRRCIKSTSVQFTCKVQGKIEEYTSLHGNGPAVH